MKGVILDCLAQMVEKKFGKDAWQNILSESRLDTKTEFSPGRDINDEKTMEIINNTCKVLDLTLEQTAEAFGVYWVNNYALRQYAIYLNRYRSAKDFIKGMDAIHDYTTKTFQNAHPPRFEIEDMDENRIRVTYKSSRNLIDFYIGLVKGVSVYYKTPIKIDKNSSTTVDLTFG